MLSPMIAHPEALLARIRQIHAEIRDRIVAECEKHSVEHMSGVASDDLCDTIYTIDRLSEDQLLEEFAQLAREHSVVLVGEGLGNDGVIALSPGKLPELRVIVDPIDGTRGLMYQKRSAWILTGVAIDRGEQTTLADIEVAVQTEIPILKQHLCDTLWSIRGQGAHGERLNRLTGQTSTLTLRPSTAKTIEQGFGGLARFFPGVRTLLAEWDDAVYERVLGPFVPGKARAFEDQYISTGGQLYELMVGHDRWIADIRPLAYRIRGAEAGLCCHPYDLCTALIASEAGCIVTDENGAELNAPMDVMTDCSWLGFANASIRDQVWPALLKTLTEQGATT